MAPRHIDPPPRGDRYARARHLATLDAERDHAHIYRISSGLEFPWDYQRALELALLRTFAVPSIGGLVDATGQFAHAGQRRYDEDFERYNREYEALRFAPAPDGRRVADHAVDVACHWVPGPLRPVMRTMVIGLMDEPLRRAFAYPEPRAASALARLGLRLRARGSRLLPPRRRSFYDHPPKVRSYPGTQHDYTVDDFGVSAPTAVEPRWRRRT